MLQRAARAVVPLILLIAFASQGQAWGQAPGAPGLVVDGSSRGGPCSDSRPLPTISLARPLCTLTAAVNIAPANSTVLVRGGDYEPLTIDGKHYAARTTFRAYSPREPVRLTGVKVTRSVNVRIEGFRVVGSIFSRENQRIEIVGNEVSPGNIENYADVDPLIEGNYVHDVPGYPVTLPEGYGIALYTYQKKQCVRAVIRGNRVERVEADPFHMVSPIDVLFEMNSASGALPRPGSGTHVDALHVQGGRGITIRNNRWDDTAHGLMFTEKDAGGVVIENNLLTNVRYGYGLNGAIGTGAKVLSNTILSRFGVNLVDETADTAGKLAGVVFMNNIFDARGNLGPGAVENYNLWIKREATKVYGPNDAFGKPRFDNNYRLLRGSPGYRAGFPAGRDMGANVDVWMVPRGVPQVPHKKRKRARRVKGLRLTSRCVGGRLHVALAGKRVRRVRSVRFSVKGRRSLDRRRPFARSLRVTHRARVRAVVTLRGGRKVTLVRTVRACRPRR